MVNTDSVIEEVASIDDLIEKYGADAPGHDKMRNFMTQISDLCDMVMTTGLLVQQERDGTLPVDDVRDNKHINDGVNQLKAVIALYAEALGVE